MVKVDTIETYKPASQTLLLSLLFIVFGELLHSSSHEDVVKAIEVGYYVMLGLITWWDTASVTFFRNSYRRGP